MDSFSHYVTGALGVTCLVQFRHVGCSEVLHLERVHGCLPDASTEGTASAIIGTPPSRQLVHVIFHAQPGWKCPRARAHNRHAHSLFAFCCCCWQATLVMVRAASLLRQCAGGRAASCCLTRSRRRTPMCSASCCRSWRMAGSLTARWVWGPGRAGTSGAATHAVCVIFPLSLAMGPHWYQLRKKSADHGGWQAY